MEEEPLEELLEVLLEELPGALHCPELWKSELQNRVLEVAGKTGGGGAQSSSERGSGCGMSEGIAWRPVVLVGLARR